MPNREWRVLIADDEPAARRGVQQLLRAWPDWRVVAECRDGSEVLAAIDAHQPDVVFIDIQMPGIDGFEVVRRRSPERMPALVFLTAYEEFALRGFDAQALDYLVKPVTEARFATTMRRLARLFRDGKRGRDDPGLLVTTARGVVRIDLTDIDWIQAEDNYARIWTGSRSFLLRESLQRLEERLGPSGFCRAHRRALIRVDGIKRVTRTPAGGCVAVLRSNAAIPVSRRQRAAVIDMVRARRV